MAGVKLYAGAKLRELRGRIGLTQKAFAGRLGVSLPYLNQMENNNRPVSSTVVVALAQEFGFDVTELSSGDEARLVSDMREALADPVFAGPAPASADLRLAASNAPALAPCLSSRCTTAYRQTTERLASLDEALGRDDARLQPSPWNEVRDFFHYCDKYLDAVDRAAERFAGKIAPGQSTDEAARQTLARHRITVVETEDAQIRHFDPDAAQLGLSRRAPPATRTFEMLLQLVPLTQEQLLDATLVLVRFQSGEARAIAKNGLANYFAGAAMMPYKRFLDAA